MKRTNKTQNQVSVPADPSLIPSPLFARTSSKRTAKPMLDSGPYIPAKLPRSRSMRKSAPSNDDLDSSCSLSVKSSTSFEMIPESITLSSPYHRTTTRQSSGRDKESRPKHSSKTKKKSVKRNQKPSPKKPTFSEVWATRSTNNGQNSDMVPSPPYNNFGTPSSCPGNTSSHLGNPPAYHTMSSIMSPGDSPLPLNITPDLPPSAAPNTILAQSSPISMRGSPFTEQCVKPIPSRPNSGSVRNGCHGDNHREVCILGVPTRPHGSESPQPQIMRSMASPAACPNTSLAVPGDDDATTIRNSSPSCIPNHLSGPSLVLEDPTHPQDIEINFEVESGYTFNALYTPRSPTRPVPLTPSPTPPQRPPPSLPPGNQSPGSPPADRSAVDSPSKLSRSASDRSQTRQVATDLTRSPKRSSFMNIIKKAKAGSKKGSDPVRSAPSSPSVSYRSGSSRGSESKYSLTSSRSPPSSSHARIPSDEQNLIRIWADQIDGGVEGYKGFLISRDTTARELLATVHAKLTLPGTDKDFFLCANFFETSIPDRPLLDTDRPLFLHQEWDTCENYRFEVRQKPKAIMLVFGDEALQYSRNAPFGRGAVEVSEDASTGRIISELVNKYQLDPCQRYHLMERRPHFDRILKSSDCPVLLQRRWVPFEDVKFVIGLSPSTPDLFGQLSTSSHTQITNSVSSSGVQTSHSMHSLASSHGSRVSVDAEDNTVFGDTDCDEEDSYQPVDPDNVSIGSIERALNLMSPEIDKPILDNTDEPVVLEKQQDISSGFDAMHNCWMGAQEEKREDNTDSMVGDSSARSDTLSCLEESLYNDLVSYNNPPAPHQSHPTVDPALTGQTIPLQPENPTTPGTERDGDATPTPRSLHLSSESCRADLKRQYKNLLAEIEETKPKLRQLEVLQSELTSMQKAYHDLKEQALRMSIEQDAQKSQIEEEIQKLKVSNQDLMKKNKDNKAEAVVSTIMELEKLYSNRIAALEKALEQKDGMVKDLEEQNKNMMTQLNVTRRQSVQLETANQLLHKRNEVLAVEKQEGEINPALFFDSDDERLALLAKQCDALQQTVSSLESTLMLRVKELNETYEDLDTNRSDLRVAEVARIEAEAQLDVNKREVSRLQTVNEEFADEIKQKIAVNGKLEQDNRHLNESIESLQLEYEDSRARVARLENALLAQEKGLEAIKNSEQSARGELTNIEKDLELANQKLRKRDEECRKLKKEVDKAKKGSSMYNLCNVLKPGETLELVSVDLPSITSQIPRGIELKEGQHGVLIDRVEPNSSAGKTHRLLPGDRVVEINLNDVSNGVYEVVRKEMESVRAMQLVVARVAPDVRVESKLRAEALKDQIKALVIDLDRTTKHCQELQGEAAQLKDDLAGVKAKQKSEISSRDNMKMAEELQNLKALLAQKDQYMKTLETTVKSKNELLVTLEMDSHRTPRSTPNSSIHQSSFSPGMSSSMREVRSPTSFQGRDSKETTVEEINR